SRPASWLQVGQCRLPLLPPAAPTLRVKKESFHFCENIPLCSNPNAQAALSFPNRIALRIWEHLEPSRRCYNTPRFWAIHASALQTTLSTTDDVRGGRKRPPPTTLAVQSAR